MQRATLSENDGALDSVLQLAHIARPFVGSELAHRGLSNPRCGTIHSPGGLLHEMGDQRRDIVAAFAQRREFYRENAQAIVKILAEAGGIDLLLQVPIGCGSDTNVDLSAARVADALQFLLLQNAQQLSRLYGPDVHVILIAAKDAKDDDNFLKSNVERVELGSLKGNEGDQNYDIPKGTDLSKFRTVVIYCERFNAIFGAAPLEKF